MRSPHGAAVVLADLLARATPALPLLLWLGCHSGAGEPERLELWAMGREGEVVQQMVPEFERRNPGTQVRVQQIPWSAAHEKLLTAYVGGAMPDVFQAGNTWLAELVVLDALEPLDERVRCSAAVRADDYFPGILDTNVIDGTTYGIPWYVDTRLLFYRRDLLARAGYDEPPRTWEAWRDAMVALEQRAASGSYAVLLPVREWQPPVVFALQLGADLLRDGGRYGDFRSPAFRAAFAFYLDLFRRGLAPRGGEASLANVYQEFASGTFSFYVTGPWNLGEFGRRLPPAMADLWATAPLPVPGRDYPGVSLAGGASLAVFRHSAHKEAAWRLIEYLSEPTQQVLLYRLSGDLPARQAAWHEADLSRDSRTRAFWTQLQSVRPLPKIAEWERVASRIAEHAEAAIRGDVTEDQALTALDENVDRILEKRRWILGRLEAESAAVGGAAE